MGIAHRKQRKQQIGVSKQQDNLYFVWLDAFHKVQSICLNGQQKDIFFPVIASFATEKQSMLFQHGRLNVNQLTELMPLSRPAVSHH